MKFMLLRRLSLLLGLLAILGILAVACGEEEEEGPTPAATTPAAGTPAAAKIGGAGIASNPREVRGLEGILTLDDGLAAWKTRPASEDRTGVTADTIKLGRTSGVTGPTAAYEVYRGPFFEAIIERINEAGGIHGRKIELITRDDQYSPTVVVQVAKELVEDDKIFGFYENFGTTPHTAVVDYIADSKVIDFLAQDGNFNNFYPTRAMIFSGYFPHAQAGMGMADTILDQTPNAKVAFVGQDDVVGQGFLSGLKYVLQDRGGQLVAEIVFEAGQTDMTPQAVQAEAANPDWVFVSAGAGPQGISLARALRDVAGYEGNIISGGTPSITAETSEMFDGVWVTQSGNKDGNNAPNDPAIVAVKELVEQEGIKWSSSQSPALLGSIEALVRVLEVAGPDLTREGFVEAVYLALDGSWKCTLCASPLIYTPEDHYADVGAEPARWSHANQTWEVMGPLKSYETSKGTGAIGNIPEPEYECLPPSADHPKGTCPWKSQ